MFSALSYPDSGLHDLDRMEKCIEKNIYLYN